MAVFQKRGIRVGVSPDPYSGTNLLVKDGLPVSQEGDVGQLDLRKVNGKYFLFTKVAVDDWRKVSQLVKTDGIGNTNNLVEGQEDEAENAVFNDLNVNTLAGAPIWKSFSFYLGAITHSRYYFYDVDDADDYAKWDAYDTDPTGFNYRSVAGQFVIPQNCKLREMHGCIANTGSTVNPTIAIYHGSITEGTGDTVLAATGDALEVSIGTMRVPYKFNQHFNNNLSAGDILVPTIKHSFSASTQTFTGNLTLKFVST